LVERLRQQPQEIGTQRRDVLESTEPGNFAGVQAEILSLPDTLDLDQEVGSSACRDVCDQVAAATAQLAQAEARPEHAKTPSGSSEQLEQIEACLEVTTTLNGNDGQSHTYSNSDNDSPKHAANPHDHIINKSSMSNSMDMANWERPLTEGACATYIEEMRPLELGRDTLKEEAAVAKETTKHDLQELATELSRHQPGTSSPPAVAQIATALARDVERMCNCLGKMEKMAETMADAFEAVALENVNMQQQLSTIREDAGQSTTTLETSSALANDENLLSCRAQDECVEANVDTQSDVFNRLWHDNLKRKISPQLSQGSCQNPELMKASDADAAELSFSVASWPLDSILQHRHSVSHASAATVSTCTLEMVEGQQGRERLASRGRTAQFSQLRRRSKPPSPLLKPLPPSVPLLAIASLSQPRQTSLPLSSPLPSRGPSTSPAPSLGKRRPSVQPAVAQD